MSFLAHPIPMFSCFHTVFRTRVFARELVVGLADLRCQLVETRTFKIIFFKSPRQILAPPLNPPVPREGAGGSPPNSAVPQFFIEDLRYENAEEGVEVLPGPSPPVCSMIRLQYPRAISLLAWPVSLQPRTKVSSPWRFIPVSVSTILD